MNFGGGLPGAALRLPRLPSCHPYGISYLARLARTWTNRSINEPPFADPSAGFLFGSVSLRETYARNRGKVNVGRNG